MDSKRTKRTILKISNLEASYGQINVLKGVCLEIGDGEIVCVLGRNGMGKSTTVKCILGMLQSSNGQIIFKGQSIIGLPSFKIARMGIGLVPEGRRIFSSLSLKENLIASATHGYWSLSRVIDLFPVFGDRLEQLASTLSGGEQQMLAIGRALMTNPSLIILDEATEGLSPIVSEQVWTVLRKVSDEGLSILIIDKLSARLRQFCDSAFILERGKTVWSGKMKNVSIEVAREYLSV